jgi:L-asparaginase type II
MKCGAILASVISIACATALDAQDASKPRIFILATGGTIAGRIDDSIIDGASLIDAVPELAEHADVRVEEFSQIGSSLMTPTHWLRLAKRINRIFLEDTNVTGVVVTHGTDTLDETAFFLNLTVRDRRPVIVVGAMRASDEISADGPGNLLNGVRLATSKEAIGKGVLVVLNEDISAARDVWKTNNRRVHAFRSPELGFLGFVDPDTVVFYRTTVWPHTTESEFDISRVDSLPNVALVSDYAGSDGSLIEHVASRNPDGMVVATFAGGRMSAGGRRAAPAAAEAGIPLVIASRVPGGRIVGNPARDVKAVVSRDLPPHKARILLMLALTRSRDLQEIQRMFDTY